MNKNELLRNIENAKKCMDVCVLDNSSAKKEARRQLGALELDVRNSPDYIDPNTALVFATKLTDIIKSY